MTEVNGMAAYNKHKEPSQEYKDIWERKGKIVDEIKELIPDLKYVKRTVCHTCGIEQDEEITLNKSSLGAGFPEQWEKILEDVKKYKNK